MLVKVCFQFGYRTWLSKRKSSQTLIRLRKASTDFEQPNAYSAVHREPLHNEKETDTTKPAFRFPPIYLGCLKEESAIEHIRV